LKKKNDMKCIYYIYVGFIPDVFGFLSSLTELLLFRNNFTGALPNSLLALPALSVIAVGNNHITSFPIELGFSKTLFLFYAENNDLTGAVPATFAENVTGLSMVDLSGNAFDCPIPPELQWTKAPCSNTTGREKKKNVC
jgi:Leucine-rich repeat (LRR) protein